MLESRGITIKGKKFITTGKGWVLSVTTFSGRPEGVRNGKGCGGTRGRKREKRGGKKK